MQDAWLRLSRTDVSDVVNLRGWPTTVVGRVALNMLPGAVRATGGTVRVAFGFTFAEDGHIAGIDLIAEPDVLAGLDLR